jgi:hypothetical protein
MWEKYCGPVATSIQTLDPVSRRQLRVFGLKLLMMIPLAVVLATRHDYPLLETISSLCLWYSVFAAIVALLQRQQLGAAWLTAWDEMVAFLGIAVLARLVSAFTA